MKRITISSSGCVHRNKNKSKFKRRKQNKPIISDQPTTRSDDYQNAGVYKGARVMKSQTDEPYVEMNAWDSSKGHVKHPTDNRIPVWSSSQLKNDKR